MLMLACARCAAALDRRCRVRFKARVFERQATV